MDGNANGADSNGVAILFQNPNDAEIPTVEAPIGIAPAKRPLRLKTQAKREQLKKFVNSVVKQCEICGEPLTNRTLRIDHNHETGKARGFLCNPCNIGLGFFEDNQAILMRARQYLARYNSDRDHARIRKMVRSKASLKAIPRWHRHPDGKKSQCLPDCRYFGDPTWRYMKDLRKYLTPWTDFWKFY